MNITKRKKLLHVMSIYFLAVICTICVTVNLFSIPAEAATNYTYIGSDGKTATASSSSIYKVNSSQTSIGAQGATMWCVAEGTVSISHNVDVVGTIHLILTDGANLSASSFTVKDGSKLYIYSQSMGGSKGSLTASKIHNLGSASTEINGGLIKSCLYNDNSAKLTINNGTITAESNEQNIAAIGAATKEGSGGTIIINGGTITAKGRCAIGSGYNGGGANITINGGSITATAKSNYGTGIGSGDGSGSTNIKITGGTVTSTGQEWGPGIGTRGKDGGTILISGGTVTATGGTEAAGIGSGWYSAAVNVTISGGTVTANGGSSGAGIGGGLNTSAGTITISGGLIYANGNNAADIGAGFSTNETSVGSLEAPDNGTAIIFADRIDSNMSKFRAGLVINSNGQLYGYSAFTEQFVIDLNRTLEIPVGASITIDQKNVKLSEGTTLVNKGTITIKPGSNFANYGVIQNAGTISVEYNESAYYQVGSFVNYNHIENSGTIYSTGTFNNASGTICNTNYIYGVTGNVSEGHPDKNKDHSCDNGCSVVLGTCQDGSSYSNKDHYCDYGCGKFFGTCQDSNKDHSCDYGKRCSQNFGVHEDKNKDHKCDYGCNNALGTCEDENKDHKCDYGCSKVHGVCEDEDKDHTCDYGCSKVHGVCEDENKDHACDYGCSKAYGICEDKDKDHACDYGCDRAFEDKNTDATDNTDEPGDTEFTDEPDDTEVTDVTESTDNPNESEATNELDETDNREETDKTDVTDATSIDDNEGNVNYKAINEAIRLAESLSSENYTGESWNNLTIALNNAKYALAADNQDLIDQAAEALTAAIESLEKYHNETDKNDKEKNDEIIENTNGCKSTIAVSTLSVCMVTALGVSIIVKKKED